MTGDGRLVLHDSADGSSPVDLPLSLVLGEMPQKTFVSATQPRPAVPLSLPAGLAVGAALDRVLRLPAVGSKRFLTNKVHSAAPPLACCRCHRCCRCGRCRRRCHL